VIAKFVVQSVVWLGAMGVVLFLGAGTLAWPGAWAFLIEMLLLSLVGGWLLYHHDPGLLAERLRPPVQKDQPPADKLLMSIFMLLMFAWLAFMGLDAVRFGWSKVPFAVQVFGALLMVASIAFCSLTMRENSFAAPVVKLQQDRGQRVISTGPYAIVRHPMYFGASFYLLSIPLLVGSWWGLLVALVLIGLLCIRIPIEERTLRAGLAGYDAYTERVRYRLIPLVW
jgi:protein-S-isoprenylcysteine O-methyltransferase Ste14